MLPQAMPITTLFDVKCPVVRLTGSIDIKLALDLIDEIRLLRQYYQFREIELEIESPGGTIDALHYIVQSVLPLRDQVVLRTRALNEVCSAAAMLLSLGTVGQRSASQFSRLLYHHSRTVFPETTARTHEQLREVSRRMREWDDKLMDMIVNHICADGSEAAQYRRRLRSLFRKEVFISGDEALQMRLIDRVL